MNNLKKIMNYSLMAALACAIGIQAMELPCSSGSKEVAAAGARCVLSDQELELAQAFHLAASSNAVDLMQDLLGQCADPTRVVDYIPDGSTDTPLIAAIKEGHTEAANLLIAYKADCMAPDTSDVKGTPLYWAASKGYAGIVKELLSAGADKTVKTAKGDTPCLVATRSKHLDVVRVLRGLELPVSASEKKVADAPQGLPYIFPLVEQPSGVPTSGDAKDASKDMPPAYQQHLTQETKDLRGAPPAYEENKKLEEKDSEMVSALVAQEIERQKAEILASHAKAVADAQARAEVAAAQVEHERAEHARIQIEQEAKLKAMADQLMIEQERAEKARAELERLEQMRVEQERAVKARADQEAAAQAQALADQIRAEKEKAEQAAKLKADQEKAEREKVLAAQAARDAQAKAEQARQARLRYITDLLFNHSRTEPYSHSKWCAYWAEYQSLGGPPREKEMLR